MDDTGNAGAAAYANQRRFFWAAVIPVFLAMTVSGNLLDFVGINYDQPGGNLIVKIHPAVYAAVGLTIYAFWGRLRVTLLKNKLLLWFFILLLISNSINLVLNPANGAHAVAQNLVSYAVGGLLCLVLTEAGTETRTTVAKLIVVLAVANTLLCVFEDATQIELIPIYLDNVTFVENPGEFRGAALYDHPLDGAMMTLIGLLVVMGRGMTSKRDKVAFLILLVGLISFGGRTAMIVGIIIVIVAGFVHVVSQMLRSSLTFTDAAKAAAIAFVLPILFCVVLTETSLGERILAHLYWDNSAQTRAFQWNIIGLMTPAEILTGMTLDRLVIAGYQIALHFPYMDIENFWLLEFVELGIIAFLFWLAAFFCLLTHCWLHASGWGRVLLVALILVASGCTGFGRKCLVLIALAPAVVSTVDLQKRQRQDDAIGGSALRTPKLIPR